MVEPLGWKPWDIERVTDYTIQALIDAVQRRDERLAAEMNGIPSGSGSDPGAAAYEDLKTNPRRLSFDEWKQMFGMVPEPREGWQAAYEEQIAEFDRMYPQSAAKED